jgi:hypothetical protein
MGELDLKSLENACKKNFSKHHNLHAAFSAKNIHAALICSELQDEIRNPNWHPFEVILVDGNPVV